MTQRFSRRTFFAGAASTLLANACAHRFASAQRDFSASVAAIQARVGGRIGAYMLDTRLDRSEVELNTNLPGDLRDTTAPQAMVASMQKVLVGEVLAPQSRQQLITWMQQSTTGLHRLRAGLPADWRPGDKTGNGAANNLLVAWPPCRSAVIAAVYMSESQQAVSALDLAHGVIGGLFAAAVARQ
jgi:beta-lactamase class A